MSILIKDMQMPSECEYCGFCRYYPENGNVWCNATNRLLKQHWKVPNLTHLDVKRPDWCPLEEQPERKTGKWIPVTNGRGGNECNQCHNYAPSWQTGEERLTAFCPNCGAKMEGNG